MVFFVINENKRKHRLKIEPELINVINLKLEVDTKIDLKDLLKRDYEDQGFHLQRLYSRRKKDDEGIMQSTMGMIMESSTGGFNEVKTRYTD